MIQRRHRPFDDGLEDEAPFGEEELAFERRHRGRDRRATTKPPSRFRETETERSVDKDRRRRGLAGLHARRAPERPQPATDRAS